MINFDEWLSQQKEKIDVDCGCVMTEVLFHCMRKAFAARDDEIAALRAQVADFDKERGAMAAEYEMSVLDLIRERDEAQQLGQCDWMKKAKAAEADKLKVEGFYRNYYEDLINSQRAGFFHLRERASNAERELEALKTDIANYVDINSQLVEENEILTSRFDDVNANARIVSYADDMATCTLNYQGEEYFFSLSGTTNPTRKDDDKINAVKLPMMVDTDDLYGTSLQIAQAHNQAITMCSININLAGYKTEATGLFEWLERPHDLDEYSRGVEAAARYIDGLREDFDSEHGITDSETGALEFGNMAQVEHSCELADLAVGIRAMMAVKP